MQGALRTFLTHGNVVKDSLFQHLRVSSPVLRPIVFSRFESVSSALIEENGFESTTIADILKEKGKSADGSWLWCTTDDTVYDAVKSMTHHNVGALVVVKHGEQKSIAGIITERGILKLHTQLKKLMAEVLHIHETFFKAVGHYDISSSSIEDYKISSFPFPLLRDIQFLLSCGGKKTFSSKLYCGDNLVNYLIVRNQSCMVGFLMNYLRKIIVQGRSSKSTKVGDIMTEENKLITVTHDTKVLKAMQLMTDKRIRHIPVIDDKGMIGMVSIGDVVRAVVTEYREELDRLNAYIQGCY
ncbi:CBS domain-containing protein CBSX3 [Populus alba x Populus x berolinensis]|uniref:CBS domain-containing protein CBSX3 n=1 Tax=Populus alba x Populus x berolinensis TaxID=444605 RepID=A0AAD6PRP5_9ROSI|nr:CBS domain-containing protein CBSX3 [Populus alba x Populus x berolinensis]